MDEFLTQQQTNMQIQKRGQRELENKIVDLQRQLEQGETKGKIVQDLEEKVKKKQEDNKKYTQEMQLMRNKYEKRLEDRVHAYLKITDWLTEIRVSYATDLDELTQKNAELLNGNEILLQQLTGLKRVRDQLRAMVNDNEEIEVEGVFMSNNEVEVLRGELMETENLIWAGIKERIQQVLSRPWEAFAYKKHQVEVSLLTDQVKMLKEDNLKLQEQINLRAEKMVDKTSLKILKDKAVLGGSLEALREYTGQDDTLSVESQKSFRFNFDLAGTKADFQTENLVGEDSVEALNFLNTGVKENIEKPILTSLDDVSLQDNPVAKEDVEGDTDPGGNAGKVTTVNLQQMDGDFDSQGGRTQNQ